MKDMWRMLYFLFIQTPLLCKTNFHNMFILLRLNSVNASALPLLSSAPGTQRNRWSQKRRRSNCCHGRDQGENWEEIYHSFLNLSLSPLALGLICVQRRRRTWSLLWQRDIAGALVGSLNSDQSEIRHVVGKWRRVNRREIRRQCLLIGDLNHDYTVRNWLCVQFVR